MNAKATDPLGTLMARNSVYIPGGVSSTNRVIDPAIAFVKAHGSYLWDDDGKRYIDYHAAFAPYFLGHNFAPVNEAVIEVLSSGESLYGAGPGVLEGRLAQLICENIAVAEKVSLQNTGSEATSVAIRLSRAVTGRQHFIVVQGGYNGNHDELACNVVNSLADLGPRVSPGEYPLLPMGAGTTIESTHFVHPVNFNDLDSVRYVCQRYPIAAMITEPILQNIGVVRPGAGYLAGLRKLADEFGFLLIFDEVKTGFRHALGGYAEIAGVTPDLVTYGKAIANGFPLAVVGGKARYMDYIIHKDPAKRPFVAGTYNGHPVGVAAAIRTIEYLIANRSQVYGHVEELGRRLETGLRDIFASHGVTASIARQGSALSYYLMPHAPVDLHDLLEHHDFEKDVQLRRELIGLGVFFVPIATKQISISAAHTAEDIAVTLKMVEQAVTAVWPKPAR
ncbi:MAG TPA: aminotransferase class III-fold pyridoxal phosphate-dependent enzyme [Steroidobacteraceae bacterium]|jgi:glutamate-1-semialdehyde 2,1-aminomutase|nr:aminotransferase class III-fold pyridoxal phosphate-dependent enzyme [Steroidobacteraceae bacterium]